jgi:prolipoprotein diacylglyceryltransferase
VNRLHPKFDLFFFDLPTYSAFVMLGAVVGLCATFSYLRLRLRHTVTLPVFLDGTWVVFVTGAIGARAYHVALNWEYYVARPSEILLLDLGGLAMRGALIAGLAGLVFYARLRNISVGKLADGAVLGLAIGQAVGWIGAYTWGANYGIVSDSPIALDLPDAYGLIAPRFPIQPLEIILFTALFIGLIGLALHPVSVGRLSLTYCLIASIVNFGLGFGRGDETLMIAGLRIDQWVDALFAVSALVILFYFIARNVGNRGINV